MSSFKSEKNDRVMPHVGQGILNNNKNRQVEPIKRCITTTNNPANM